MPDRPTPFDAHNPYREKPTRGQGDGRRGQNMYSQSGQRGMLGGLYASDKEAGQAWDWYASQMPKGEEPEC